MKNKTKKRVLLMILAGVMALAAPACGKKDDGKRKNADRQAYMEVQNQLTINYQYKEDSEKGNEGYYDIVDFSISEDGQKAAYLYSYVEGGTITYDLFIGSFTKGEAVSISYEGKDYEGTECEITPVIEKDHDPLSFKMAEIDADTMIIEEEESNKTYELKKTDEDGDYEVYDRRMISLDGTHKGFSRTDEESKTYQEAVEELSEKYYYSKSGKEPEYRNENSVYFAVNEDWSKGFVGFVDYVGDEGEFTAPDDSFEDKIGNLTANGETTISYEGKEYKAKEYSLTPFYEMDFQPVTFSAGETDSGDVILSLGEEVYEVKKSNSDDAKVVIII